MKESLIKEKSFRFSVRIVKMSRHLRETKKEFIISKQVLRCGTSVGTNVREALNAESRADFIHKLGIAQKEADETLYWLELLKETEYIDEAYFSSIHIGCCELLKMLRSIILTSKQNLLPKK